MINLTMSAFLINFAVIKKYTRANKLFYYN